MWGNSFDTSQDRFQLVLLIIVVISIPLMLLVKPIYLINKNKHKNYQHIAEEGTPNH
jgi:hypothetical protein